MSVQVAPLRVYLHQGGLVLFSSKTYQPEEVDDDLQGHLTNYAQVRGHSVWTNTHT